MSTPLPAQYFSQYFDGNDTSTFNSVIVYPDTAAGNLWQVGPPQKTRFNMPATAPNVLVTDTVQVYPENNRSSFSFGYNNQNWGVQILAIQWMQKLDMRYGLDAALIEFSLDTGNTWLNAFTDPNVYNFYGYDLANVGAGPAGDMGFSGTDTVWRNVWLCFDMFSSGFTDTVVCRFTFLSDSADATGVIHHDGWMIDNLIVHPTFVHTVGEAKAADRMLVFPSVSTGLFSLRPPDVDELLIIEEIEVFDNRGQLLLRTGQRPLVTTIDLRDRAAGAYVLKVRSNLRTDTFPIFVQR